MNTELDALRDEMMADSPLSSTHRVDDHQMHRPARSSADPSQRCFSDKQAFFDQRRHVGPEDDDAPAAEAPVDEDGELPIHVHRGAPLGTPMPEVLRWTTPGENIEERPAKQPRLRENMAMLASAAQKARRGEEPTVPCRMLAASVGQAAGVAAPRRLARRRDRPGDQVRVLVALPEERDGRGDLEAVGGPWVAPVANEEGILIMYNHKPMGLMSSVRCIVGCHLAKDAGEYATYSPAALGVGHYELLLLAAMQRWRLSAALLQGKELPAERAFFMRLPHRLSNDLMGKVRNLCGDGYRADLLRTKNGAFGLAESARLLYQRARTLMTGIGFRKSRLAPCVLRMWDTDSSHGEPALKALLSLHVDDGLAAGTCAATSMWKGFQGRLRLAVWNEVATDSTKFLGRRLRQESDYAATIDLDASVSGIQCVQIHRGRSGDDALIEAAFGHLRKLVGCVECLAYAPKFGQHDITFGTSWCQ